MRTVTLAAAIIALAPFSAAAYPIPEVPLWELIERAQVVALVRVAEVREVRTTGLDLGGERPVSSTSVAGVGAVADLDVREVWKGAAPRRIEVPFPAGLVCPAPPSLPVGELRIVFLTLSGGVYRTVALSYGARRATPENTPELRRLILAAVRLQASGEVPPAARKAWLEAEAALPVSRHVMSEDGDRALASIDWAGTRAIAAQLSPEQLRAIADDFVRDPPTNQILPTTLVLLSAYPSAEVDRGAALAIDSLLASGDRPRLLATALPLLLERLAGGDGARSPPATNPLPGDGGETVEQQLARYRRLRAALGPGPVESGPQSPGAGGGAPQ